MNQIKEKIKHCKSLSEMSEVLFNINNTTFRDKTKSILTTNNIDWHSIIAQNKKEKIRTCLNCNKKFKSSKPRKYCSVECFHKHVRVKRKCLACGKILDRSAKSIVTLIVW